LAAAAFFGAGDFFSDGVGLLGFSAFLVGAGDFFFSVAVTFFGVAPVAPVAPDFLLEGFG